ncbi:MAG: DUF393 domain-containing protein [Bacteroidetes bacterium]|nr:DUF393 domain-containing protein [Bacteroidota bacterium]MCY4205408.1 DUF393 domain-containing protein [Bacteroidota bacterium]
MAKKPEIIYDGECIFCNESISWLRKHDHKGQLSYQTLLPGATCVKLRDEEGTWEASTAVLRALRYLGGVWSFLASVLMLIPRSIRDGIYRIIARHRHRLPHYWFWSNSK